MDFLFINCKRPGRTDARHFFGLDGFSVGNFVDPRSTRLESVDLQIFFLRARARRRVTAPSRSSSCNAFSSCQMVGGRDRTRCNEAVKRPRSLLDPSITRSVWYVGCGFFFPIDEHVPDERNAREGKRETAHGIIVFTCKT